MHNKTLLCKGQAINYVNRGSKILGEICVVYLVIPLPRDHKILQFPLFSIEIVQ